MRHLVIVLSLLAAGLLALNCVGGGDSGFDEPKWAAQVCAVAQRLDDDLDAVDDEVDPTSLSLEERKARTSRVDLPAAEAYEAAAEALLTISPPPGASAFHEAQQRAVAEVAEAYMTNIAEIMEANSTGEVAASTATFAAAFARASENVTQAADSISDEAQAALREIDRCGRLPN